VQVLRSSKATNMSFDKTQKSKYMSTSIGQVKCTLLEVKSTLIYFTLRKAHFSTSSTVLVCPFIHMFACTMFVCVVCVKREDGGGEREKERERKRERTRARERESERECEQASASVCERDSHAHTHTQPRQKSHPQHITPAVLDCLFVTTEAVYYCATLLLSTCIYGAHEVASHYYFHPTVLACTHSLCIHRVSVCVRAREREIARERVR